MNMVMKVYSFILCTGYLAHAQYIYLNIILFLLLIVSRWNSRDSCNLIGCGCAWAIFLLYLTMVTEFKMPNHSM